MNRLGITLAAITVFAAALGTVSPAHALNNNLPASGDVLLCSGRPWIDVRCNGALGDDSNDDTAAINATVVAAITGNFPVHFPIGTYKVTSKLTWDYQGIAANGLQIISRGAVIDGRTISSGNVLQMQCSGGTAGSPITCNNLLIEGDFYVQGNTPAYAVVIGKTDFSDIHNAAKIDHLVVTNASAAAGAGGIQANYLTDGDLWLSGTTAGGSSSIAAIAFEQVQTSRIGGFGSAVGSSAAALLWENGATIGNSVLGFNYGATTNTCLSITSATAMRNTIIAPVFSCTTAINAVTNANLNQIIGPTYSGTNQGPLSTGISIIGRGALGRYIEPAAASYTAFGVDDGNIVSAKNAIGPVITYNGSLSTAASLPVTLPVPSQVGAGWTAGFVTDGGKAVVLTAPAGVKILAGGLQLGTLTLGPVNYEIAVVESDGSNFRLLYLSQRTQMLNGLTTNYPSAWQYLPGPGYQATLGDNGNVLSSALTETGLSVTLPSITGISNGWSVAFAADAKPITVMVSGVNGGAIVLPTGNRITTWPIPSLTNYAALQFDGAYFRVISLPNVIYSLNTLHTITGVMPDFNINQIIVNDNASVTVGSTFGVGFSLGYNYGGPNAQGGRVGANFAMTLSAPTNPFGTNSFGANTANRNYVGLQAESLAQSGDGGAGLNLIQSRGAFFAYSGYAISYPGATNLLELAGSEINCASMPGSSVYYKTCWSLVPLSGDTVHGTAYDDILAISANAGVPPWNHGIAFQPGNGEFPIGGALIVATGPTTTDPNFVPVSYLTQTANAGATSLIVASLSSGGSPAPTWTFTNGQAITIRLDDTSRQYATVVGTPVGHTISITPGLRSIASAGNDVWGSGKPQALIGMDFSDVIFTQAFIKSAGFSVLGIGTVVNTGMPTNCTGQQAGTLWTDLTANKTVKQC